MPCYWTCDVAELNIAVVVVVVVVVVAAAVGGGVLTILIAFNM